jgi:hypothetical protein
LFVFITWQEFTFFWTRRGHGEFVAGPGVHAASIFRDPRESTGESRSLDQAESSVNNFVGFCVWLLDVAWAFTAVPRAFPG